MRIYLDICCLKRPFDDQSQPRIAVETAAVLGILRQCSDGSLTPVRSIAHDLENAYNPDPRRAAAVAAWLSTLPTPLKTSDSVRALLPVLRRHGLSGFDALHLASAVELAAAVFLSTDDRLLSRAGRATQMKLPRLLNPAAFIEEVK